MARPDMQTIPDNKKRYFREQLYRELAHMFKWEGLPSNVPSDYIERNLVRFGYVMYYYSEVYGDDVLRCEVQGYNRHNLPVTARTFTPNTVHQETTITRNLKWLSDGEDAVPEFDKKTDGVLITNMHLFDTQLNNSMGEIVNHFTERLALSQQAIDTQLMYANIPYIFQSNDEDTRLSIEKMFDKIYNGRPLIIADNKMFTDNKERTGLPTDIKFIGKEIMDIQNEIMMKFRETVGFNTAGVDKAERVNTLEIRSNDQHTQTVLQIMLEQRQRACEAIKEFFGQEITVELVGQEEIEEEQEEIDNGADNGGIGQTSESE